MDPSTPSPERAGAARVVAIDDDPHVRVLATRLLRAAGFEVEVFDRADAAWEAIADRLDGLDAVLTDLMMPGLDGLGLLARVRDRAPTLPVVVMTAHATLESAVDAVRKGAYDYIAKPFEIPEAPVLAVRRAVEHRQLARRREQLETQLERIAGVPGVIARASAMRDVLHLVEVAAPTDATVLLLGESGTGKEVIARAIHQRGPRRGRPFVAVNCSALPDTLLESELFGYVKGAFTGAIADRRGLFDEASGGTLFLDEVGDVTPAMQVRLLRALQEGEIRPVGGAAARRVDVRIIAATNRDLRAAMRDGRFREDLYFRLHVLAIELPPLRARVEDVPLLVQHFVTMYGERYGKPRLRVAPAALDAILRYPWPGNVRELENAIQRAVIVAPGRELTPETLPPHVAGGAAAEAAAAIGPDGPTVPLREARAAAVAEVERRYLERALEATGGNLARAARLAGEDKSNLRRLARRHGLDPASFRRG